MFQLNSNIIDSIVDQDIVHTINLNIFGISVDNVEIIELGNGIFSYPEINLILPTCENNGEFTVARKVPIVPSSMTPYTYRLGNIYFNDNIVFNKYSIKEVPLENGKPRNFKGYSLSFEGTKSPYFELRINPKNTGKCPGKCAFCHRKYSYRLTPELDRKEYSPSEILNSICQTYGNDILSKISHVSIITELYGNEHKFLEFLNGIKKEFEKYGVNRLLSFGACSQDVRTLDGMRELYRLVTPKKYSFTLETFSKRKEIMGKYKGISIPSVIDILLNARKANFKEIKLNYVSGIDSYYDFEQNIRELRKLNLVDSIGISIFTAFFSDQKYLRHKEAYDIDYYLRIVKLVKELGIKFYRPDCYEMGIPLKLLG
ncbi:MAG: hypothetical protein CVU10_07705 [Bacteroidetes bacterium HGW-Bacteroidetes-5]|jgi:hypothetical protein|nr:MAG: hypothetical protein CVU10_07705 [Bacteroidetes bacterium HGW-Bacteroidetes-5]